MANEVNEVERVIREVVQILHDSQKGFAEIGHGMRDERLKALFLEESQVRAGFRGDLESELHRLGVHDIKESGTAVGAIHRVWGEVKMKFGGSDHTLLETAEQGEDKERNVYTDALEQDLPVPIKELLVTQQEHIMESYDMIRSFRDATKAA